MVLYIILDDKYIHVYIFFGIYCVDNNIIFYIFCQISFSWHSLLERIRYLKTILRTLVSADRLKDKMRVVSEISQRRRELPKLPNCSNNISLNFLKISGKNL